MIDDKKVESSTPPAEAEETLLQKLTPLLIFCGVAVFVALKWPTFALQAAVFAATLGILVFVHELGHYQVARWAGMKVNRFGIGFPPWLYSFRHKGIDYSIGALPIGGMVDIAGLGSEEEMVGTATTGDLPENRRNPHAPHGTKNFQDASLGWRFATLFAGPLMNFLFAVVVAMFLFCWMGVPTEKSAYFNYVAGVQAGKPAAAAGLQKGDILVRIKQFDTSNVLASQYKEQVADRIRANGTKPLTIVVKRGDQLLTKKLTPVLGYVDAAKKEKVPMLGISFGLDSSRVQNERLGVGEALSRTWSNAVMMTTRVMTLIGHALTVQMTAEERDNIQGVVAIAHTVGTTAKEYDWRSSVALAISISMNLGLMNLLPFPALDGGRIMFLGYEFVMRKPFDPKKEGIIHMAGMALLLVFMLFIAFRDVVRIYG